MPKLGAQHDLGPIETWSIKAHKVGAEPADRTKLTHGGQVTPPTGRARTQPSQQRDDQCDPEDAMDLTIAPSHFCS
jgi:hypothetical protein